MKVLVNLIQLLVVAAIIFPIMYIWETDKVDKFCQKIKPGMKQETYLNLVDEHNVKLVEVVGTEVEIGRWHAIIKTHLPLITYQCQIKGVSKLVVTATIIKSAAPTTEKDIAVN